MLFLFPPFDESFISLLFQCREKNLETIKQYGAVGRSRNRGPINSGRLRRDYARRHAKRMGKVFHPSSTHPCYGVRSVCGWSCSAGDGSTYPTSPGNAHKSIRCGGPTSQIPKIRSSGIKHESQKIEHIASPLMFK